MIFSLCMEYWNVEQMNIFSGYVGPVEQGSFVILNTLYSFFFCTGHGFQQAASALIGSNIGRCDIHRAKEYMHVIFITFELFLLIQIIFEWTFREQLISCMTNLKDVKACILANFLYFALNQCLDVTRSVQRGVIKGLGL